MVWFAVSVWGVSVVGKTEETVAEEGLQAMEAWMRRIGLVMNISDLGAEEDMLDGIVKSTLIMQGGYKVLTADDVLTVLKNSL